MATSRTYCILGVSLRFRFTIADRKVSDFLVDELSTELIIDIFTTRQAPFMRGERYLRLDANVLRIRIAGQGSDNLEDQSVLHVNSPSYPSCVESLHGGRYADSVWRTHPRPKPK